MSDGDFAAQKRTELESILNSIAELAVDCGFRKGFSGFSQELVEWGEKGKNIAGQFEQVEQLDGIF